MEWIFGFLVWIFGSFAVAGVAHRWGRNQGGYLLAAFVLSPVIAGLILVAEGESKPAPPPAPWARSSPPATGAARSPVMRFGHFVLLMAGALVMLGATVGAAVYWMQDDAARPRTAKPLPPLPRKR